MKERWLITIVFKVPTGKLHTLPDIMKLLENSEARLLQHKLERVGYD